MSSTAGDEGQSGRFGAKEVRTRGLPLAAIFMIDFFMETESVSEVSRPHDMEAIEKKKIIISAY